MKLAAYAIVVIAVAACVLVIAIAVASGDMKRAEREAFAARP